MNSTASTLYTSQFFLLCLSSFLFFMGFQGILPELIIFLDEVLDAGHLSGWVLPAFTFVAGLSRPYSGKLTDIIGRRPIILFGGIASTLACLIYIILQHPIAHLLYINPVLLFFFIRSFHGLSTGFAPTGSAAMLADILPIHRRGEGMGWMGFAGAMGMAAGPKLSNFLHLEYGYDIMFIGAALLSMLSVVVVINMKETLPENKREKLKWSHLRVNKSDVYEPLVIPSALTFVFYAASFGAVFTLIPIHFEKLGFADQRGNFFMIYMLTAGIARILTGKLSDWIGRVPVIGVGIILVTISLLLLGSNANLNILFFAGGLYGLAHGTVGPALFAWTTDLSHPDHIGRGFSTMFIGMEIGISLGAILSGFLYNRSGQTIFLAFVATAFLCFLAFCVVLFYRKRKYYIDPSPAPIT